MASDGLSPMDSGEAEAHSDTTKDSNPEEDRMDTSVDNDGGENDRQAENDDDVDPQQDSDADANGSHSDSDHEQQQASGDGDHGADDAASDEDSGGGSSDSDSDSSVVDPIAMEDDKEEEDPNFSEGDASDFGQDGRPDTPDPPNVVNDGSNAVGTLATRGRSRSAGARRDSTTTPAEKLKSETSRMQSAGAGRPPGATHGGVNDKEGFTDGKPNAPGWPLPNPKDWAFPQPGIPSCAMLSWTIRRDLVKFLMKKSDADPFVSPVEVDRFPTYSAIIKHPICLKDILKKIQAEKEGYSGEQFDHDLRLVFANAQTFSDPNSYIWDAIKRLRGLLDSRIYKEQKKVEISKRRPRTRTRKKQESDLQTSLHKAVKRRGGRSAAGGRKQTKRRRLQGEVDSASPPIIEGHVESRPSSPSAEGGANGSRSPTEGRSRGRSAAGTNGGDGASNAAASSREQQMFDQRIGGDGGPRRAHPMATAASSSGGSPTDAGGSDDGPPTNGFGLASLFERHHKQGPGSGSGGSANNSGRSSPLSSYADVSSRGPSLATALIRSTQIATTSQNPPGTLSGSIRGALDRRPGSRSPRMLNGFGALGSDVMTAIRPPPAGEASSESPTKRRRLSGDAASASTNDRRPYETGPPPLERDDSHHAGGVGEPKERRSSSSHNSRGAGGGRGSSRSSASSSGRGGGRGGSSSKKKTGGSSSNDSSKPTGRKSKKNVVAPGKPKGRPRRKPTKKSAPAPSGSSSTPSNGPRFSGTIMEEPSSSFSPAMNGASDDPRRRHKTTSPPSASPHDSGSIPSLAGGMVASTDGRMLMYSSLSESERRTLQQQQQRMRYHRTANGDRNSSRASSLEGATSPNSQPRFPPPGANYPSQSTSSNSHSQSAESLHSHQQRNSARQHGGGSGSRQRNMSAAQQRVQLLRSQQAAAAQARAHARGNGAGGSVIDISSPSGGQDFPAPHPMANRGGRQSFSSSANGSPTDIAAARRQQQMQQQQQQQHTTSNSSNGGGDSGAPSSSPNAAGGSGAHPAVASIPPGQRPPRPGMTSNVPVPESVRRMITARSAELHKRMKAASNEVCDIFSDYLRLETQYKFVCYERDMILRENLTLHERHNDAKKEMQQENNNLLHTASEFKRENAHLKELVADLKKQLAASPSTQANGEAQAQMALASRLENELRITRSSLAEKMASSRKDKDHIRDSRDTVKRLRLQVQQYKDREETLRARIKATLS